MAANLEDLLAGLATNLEAIPNVKISTDIVTDHKPPVLFVRPGDPVVTYHQAMRNGVEEWELIIEGWAGGITYPAAMAQFTGFASASGATSIKAAVEADMTLGGACAAAVVTEVRGYQESSSTEGRTVIRAEWLVSIKA